MSCARTLNGALVLGMIVTLWVTGCPQMPSGENDNNSNTGGSSNTNDNVGEPSSNDNSSNDNTTGGNSNANDNTPSNDNESDNTASNDNGSQNDNLPTGNDNSPSSNQNANGNANGNENGGGGGSGSNDNAAENENTTGSVSGQEFSIEPDDYDDGTDLTDINPYVTLSVTQDDNVTVESFPVTASDDGLDLAPTGDRVFGHSNIQFFNSDRRLRMDFSTDVQVVSILFAGGTFFETEVGRLVVFDENGNQLAEVISPQKGAGIPELLQITREEADIAWAIAYVAENEGSFGRFDLLSFTLPEEEP